MVELTIKVNLEVISKLKSLQDRVNENLAPAIDQRLERPVNIERIAAALVRMGLSESSKSEITFKRDKITFAVMVAQQQIANNRGHAGKNRPDSKGAIVYKKNQEKRSPKNGNGEE